MPHTDSRSPIQPECKIFPPRPLFLAVPAVIALGAGSVLVWWAPAASWAVIPLFFLVLILTAVLNSGIIVSERGMEWYALNPRWRFRRVPWSAVVEIRKGLFGIGNWIRLTLEAGRYEPWAWGYVRPERNITIEIRLGGIMHAQSILPLLESWLAWRDGLGIADAKTAVDRIR